MTPTKTRSSTRGQARTESRLKYNLPQGRVDVFRASNCQKTLPAMVDAATSGEGVIEQKKHMGPNNFEVVLELESSDDENLPDAFAIFSTVGRRASRDEKQQDEVIVVDSDDKDEEVGPVREVEDVKSQKRRVQQERSSEFTSAIQGAFYALAGWQSLEDILPTQKGQDGQPSFWVVDGSEERRVKPAWDLGFDKNWDEWGPAFYKTYRCQVKKNNGLHAKHLLKMSSQTVRRHLAAGLWTICARVAKEKSNGKTETDWQEPQHILDPSDSRIVTSLTTPLPAPDLSQQEAPIETRPPAQKSGDFQVKPATSTTHIRVCRAMKRKVRG